MVEVVWLDFLIQCGRDPENFIYTSTTIIPSMFAAMSARTRVSRTSPLHLDSLALLICLRADRLAYESAPASRELMYIV